MRFVTVVAVLAMASLAWAGNTIESPAGFGNTSDATEWGPAKELIVKWVQLPDLAGSAVSSEWCDDIGLITDLADDFYCDDGIPIVALEWWSTYYGCQSDPPSPIDFFIVRFYTDVPGPPFSHPGTVLYDQAVYSWTEEYTTGGDMFSQFYYSADLPVPFLQEAGNIYWIQIQAVHTRTGYCQWGWAQCLPEYQWNDQAVLKSDYFGVPDWTPLDGLIGYWFEPSFVLYGETYSPVEETSWTTIKELYR